MSRYQINFRCDKMLRDILIVKENHSEWIRDACWERLNREGDQTLINKEIQELENRIKELKERKKDKHIDQDKINELLRYHAPNYKLNAQTRLERQRIDFIKRSIMPQLKKFGYNGSPEDIDQLLLNFPED